MTLLVASHVDNLSRATEVVKALNFNYNELVDETK